MVSHLTHCFTCPICQSDFESEGIKKEFQDRVYGSCWKRTAHCPTCDTECEEYRQKLTAKQSADFDSMVSGLQKKSGGCCSGGGCCG